MATDKEKEVSEQNKPKKKEVITDETVNDVHPLLGAKVKEREHSLNDTSNSDDVLEDTIEETSSNLFGPAESPDDYTLVAPKLENHIGDSKEDVPDLEKMKVSDEQPNNVENPAENSTIGQSASDFGWQIIQDTIPDMVHEVARMDKSEVDAILKKAGERCGQEETEIIEDINDRFRQGLELSNPHKKMGKEALKQLLISKGAEKKLTPEFMLAMVFIMILISWGLAFRKFNREKRDLFQTLKDAVDRKLKLDKEKESKTE